MKTLKFVPELAQMIRDGSKTATWRYQDEKDFQVGDEVDLIDRADGQVFARAVVSEVRVKALGELTEADRIGHEPFESDEQMYRTYTQYYGDPFGPDTKMKLIWFELQ